MARLANGRYVYREDLGGLCNICNEYGYEVFDTLINIIQLNVNEKETKVNMFITYIYILLVKKSKFSIIFLE